MCNYIHPKAAQSLSSTSEIAVSRRRVIRLRGRRLVYTRWLLLRGVKADFEIILERHAVHIRKTLAEFREASARRHDASSQEYHFDNNVPYRTPVQKRLSVHNWNPGPRRGKEGALEKQIAGKWHVITLQEAIEYVDHELLTNRFHVTHYGGCAVLFNKDTFIPDVKVKSIYPHDIRRVLPDKVVEGDSGWVLQGVLSRASFRRQPHSGQKSLTVITNNSYAKKRGIGKKLILTIRAVMLDEEVDLVAGDFIGVAWRRDNSYDISIIEEAFADCALPMPSGPTPLWKMESSSARHILHPPRSSGHPLDRSELPSRIKAPPGFCLMAQRSITSRKTRSTDSLERTFHTVPLLQTEGSHKRG